MATTSFIRIIDAARTHCPAALEGTMRRELFDVLREFFDVSSIWLFQLPVFVQPNANDYVLNPNQNVIVTKLMDLSRPRTPPPLPIAYLPMTPPQYLQIWNVNGVGGTNEAIDPLFNVPREGMLLDAGIQTPILRIRWNPQAYETWIATLALNLADPTDGEGLPNVPDWILTKYYRYIIDGLIMRLMLEPGKPYSSQTGAAFHGRKFNYGCGVARTESRHMFTYSAQRWAFPQGWNYRRPYIRG